MFAVLNSLEEVLKNESSRMEMDKSSPVFCSLATRGLLNQKTVKTKDHGMKLRKKENDHNCAKHPKTPNHESNMATNDCEKTFQCFRQIFTVKIVGETFIDFKV